MISELHTGSINDSLDLITNNELKVLRSILITNEQPILYFDHSHEIFFFLIFLDRLTSLLNVIIINIICLYRASVLGLLLLLLLDLLKLILLIGTTRIYLILLYI